jgi:hypothetical protein
MGWSAEFIEFISGSVIQPSWLVSTVKTLSGWGGEWSAATERDRLGATADIVPASVVAVGTRLSVSTWTATGGSFSFAITDYRDAIYNLVRGDIVALYLGRAGWDNSQFQRVAIGVVRQVAANGSGQGRIECLDAMGLFRSRPNEDAASQQLFESLDDGTGVSAAIADPSGYTGGTTITVAGTAEIFGFDEDGVGIGAVRVQAETPYFVTFTGVDGTTLTGCESGAFGSMHSDVAIGTVINSVALLRGIPHDTFAKVLSSTGTPFSNGAYDTLPADWGYALSHAYFDGPDLLLWRNAYEDDVSGTDASWDIVAETAQPDGLRFLTAAFKIGGFFPVIRQGGFSMHHATRLLSTDPRTTITINDDDIAAGASAIDYRSFYDGQPIEFGHVEISRGPIITTILGAVTITTPSTTTFGADEVVGTCPAVTAYEASLINPAMPDVSMVTHSNAPNVVGDVVDRLEPLTQRIGEWLRLRCSGLRLAQLSVGEVCFLTTSRWTGRSDTSRGYVENKAGLVIAVDVDWGGGEVAVELLFRPIYNTVYP